MTTCTCVGRRRNAPHLLGCPAKRKPSAPSPTYQQRKARRADHAQKANASIRRVPSVLRSVYDLVVAAGREAEAAAVLESWLSGKPSDEAKA